MRSGPAQAYVDQLVDRMVLIRVVPGRLRTWDFADDYAPGGEN